MAQGYFITFEGGEGVGKSTHICILENLLADHGIEVVRLREPGGTAVSEALRAVVLDPAHSELSDRAELLIYEAARAQLVEQVIAPALARGAVVLCDRFTDSTLAYQGAGRGLDSEFIAQANGFATQGITPDKTLLFICGGADKGLQRATAHSQADRLESAGLDFHQKVDQAFFALAEAEPERVALIDSSGSHIQTAQAVLEALQADFPFLEAILESPEALAAAVDHGRTVKHARDRQSAQASAQVKVTPSEEAASEAGSSSDELTPISSEAAGADRADVGSGEEG